MVLASISKYFDLITEATTMFVEFHDGLRIEVSGSRDEVSGFRDEVGFCK